MSVFPFVTESVKGISIQEPSKKEVFTGSRYPNCILDAHVQFVEGEVRSLIQKGCLVPWAQVQGSDGPRRPRLIQALSVEPSKPRLVYYARPLNEHCIHVPFSLDTVGTFAGMA